MMATAERMAVVFKRYDRLTNGHAAGRRSCTGAKPIRCRAGSRRRTYRRTRRRFLSEQSRSATVTYGAALLLGINAIYRSDMAGLQKAVDYLENKARSYAFCRAQAWAHTWRRRCGAICWG